MTTRMTELDRIDITLRGTDALWFKRPVVSIPGEHARKVERKNLTLVDVLDVFRESVDPSCDTLFDLQQYVKEIPGAQEALTQNGIDLHSFEQACEEENKTREQKRNRGDNMKFAGILAVPVGLVVILLGVAATMFSPLGLIPLIGGFLATLITHPTLSVRGSALMEDNPHIHNFVFEYAKNRKHKITLHGEAERQKILAYLNAHPDGLSERLVDHPELLAEKSTKLAREDRTDVETSLMSESVQETQNPTETEPAIEYTHEPVRTVRSVFED